MRCLLCCCQHDGLVDVKEMLRSSDPLTHRRLRGTMEVLLTNSDTYLGLYASLHAGSGAGKTKLDRYRLKTCKNHVVSTPTPSPAGRRFTEPIHSHSLATADGHEYASDPLPNHCKPTFEVILTRPSRISAPDIEKLRICYYSAPERGAEYCDERVCLCVCVHACVCVCL